MQCMIHADSHGCVEGTQRVLSPLQCFPTGLERVIAKALKKKPQERYQPAAELEADLTSVRGELPPLAPCGCTCCLRASDDSMTFEARYRDIPTI
jgi:hypothetical protein